MGMFIKLVKGAEASFKPNPPTLVKQAQPKESFSRAKNGILIPNSLVTNFTILRSNAIRKGGIRLPGDVLYL
jgi:hypothetical protein